MNFHELVQHLVTSTSEVARRIAQQYPRLARDDPRDVIQQSTHSSVECSSTDNAHQRVEGSKDATRHQSLEGQQSKRPVRQRTQTKHLNVSTLGDISNSTIESTASLGKAKRRAVLQAKLFGDSQQHLPPEVTIDFDKTMARDIPTPTSFKLAMRGPYRKYWLEAARLELDNMKLKGVYELVRLAPGEKIRPIRGKWVLKVKKKENGTVEKFRARYVALGNTQRAGLDYRKTTAPVLNAVSLRCLFAVATEFDWPLK